MDKSKRNLCGQCWWWSDIEARDDKGLCRRYPPAVYKNIGDVYAEWPTTYYSDFCGEFNDGRRAEKTLIG